MKGTAKVKIHDLIELIEFRKKVKQGKIYTVKTIQVNGAWGVGSKSETEFYTENEAVKIIAEANKANYIHFSAEIEKLEIEAKELQKRLNLLEAPKEKQTIIEWIKSKLP